MPGLRGVHHRPSSSSGPFPGPLATESTRRIGERPGQSAQQRPTRSTARPLEAVGAAPPARPRSGAARQNRTGVPAAGGLGEAARGGRRALEPRGACWRTHRPPLKRSRATTSDSTPRSRCRGRAAGGEDRGQIPSPNGRALPDPARNPRRPFPGPARVAGKARPTAVVGRAVVPPDSLRADVAGGRSDVADAPSAPARASDPTRTPSSDPHAGRRKRLPPPTRRTRRTSAEPEAVGIA